MTGKTVLYIPEEKRVPEDPADAVKDKELVSSSVDTFLIQYSAATRNTQPCSF